MDAAASRGLAGRKPRQIRKTQTSVILSGLLLLFCRNSKCVLKLSSPADCRRLFGEVGIPNLEQRSSFLLQEAGQNPTLASARTGQLPSCTVQGPQHFVGTQTKLEIDKKAACSVLRAAPGWQGWAQLPRRTGLGLFPITRGLLTSSRCFTIGAGTAVPAVPGTGTLHGSECVGALIQTQQKPPGRGRNPFPFISHRHSLTKGEWEQEHCQTKPLLKVHGGTAPSRPTAGYLSTGAGPADDLGTSRGLRSCAPRRTAPKHPALPPVLRTAVGERPRRSTAWGCDGVSRKGQGARGIRHLLQAPPHSSPTVPGPTPTLWPELRPSAPPEQGLEMKQTQMTSRHRQRSPASCRTAEYSLYCFS